MPQAIEVGQTAKELSLARNCPSRLRCLRACPMRWAAARLERFYAFVQTKDGDLGEQLVRNGLARNYGFKAVPPGLRNSRLELEKLQQFEDEAKQEKIGGWGVECRSIKCPCSKASVF